MRGPDVGQSWMLLVAGVIFVGAVLGLHHQNLPYDDGISTIGTISEFAWETEEDDGISYERRISFTVAGNRTVDFWDINDQGAVQPVIGEKVAVSYRAGNPEQAKVVPPFSAETYWSTVAFFVLSLGLALTGLAGLVGSAVRSRRRRGEWSTRSPKR